MTQPSSGPSATSASWASFFEDDGRKRFGAEVPTRDRVAEVGQAHAPLYERRDALGLFELHVERRLSDHGRAIRREEDSRRGENVAVAVRDRDRPAAIVERRDGAERGAEVDADQGHGVFTTGA